jgi:hypothetical protein
MKYESGIEPAVRLGTRSSSREDTEWNLSSWAICESGFDAWQGQSRDRFWGPPSVQGYGAVQSGRWVELTVLSSATRCWCSPI